MPGASILTIFSEQGDKFFLVLDGAKQNDKPLARVKVDNLPRPYYKCKIIFDNDALPALDASVQLEGVDARYNDVSYVIKKKTHKGKTSYVIRPYSFIALSAPAPADQPDPIAPPATVPNSNGPQNGQTTIVVPGATITMPVIVTPDGPATAPPTTPSNMTDMGNDTRPQSAKEGCTRPMASDAFALAKENLEKIGFEDTRLTQARTMLKGNCLTVNQVRDLAGIFNFEANRLILLKVAYPRTVDKSEYYLLTDALKFSSSKDDLNQFLAAQN